MATLMTRGLAAAAGLIFATAAGATVATAASTPSPTASATPGNGALHRGFRLPHVAGVVVSDRSSGGSLNAGVLMLKEPGGTVLTLNLSPKTKAWQYQGLGVKPGTETASAIPQGEIVVVIGRKISGNLVAGRILDLGFKAASS